MDIAIYVNDRQAAGQMQSLIASVGRLPDGYALRVVEVQGGQQALPAEVVRIMVQRRDKALPLVAVDGAPTIAGRLPTPYEMLSLLPNDGTRPALITKAESSAQFATDKRFHISMNCSDLEQSTAFYTVLFGAPPNKVKAKYAKWELAEPALNFTLNERDFQRPKKEGAIGHFGLQVKSSERVLETKRRYIEAGFNVEEETQTACCFAVQTKIWVADPDLNKWEVYVVTEAESEAGCGPDCVCLICYKDMKASYAKPV